MRTSTTRSDLPFLIGKSIPKKISLYKNFLVPTSHNLFKEQYLTLKLTSHKPRTTNPPRPKNMKFITSLTTPFIAALLAATSGLTSAAGMDVCAGGVKLACDTEGYGLIWNLDFMDAPRVDFEKSRE